MKLHKSFIAKFVQASLFSCLSFSAYAQDVNSEENKPLPLNDEGYEARKESITNEINKAVEDIKNKEKALTYDTFEDSQLGLARKKNQNISGVFNKHNENGAAYLFDVGGSNSTVVDNLKLINNANIASGSEVFSDQWLKPGIKYLAYIENNANITGKGTYNPTEHGIFLHSSRDFYFKNSGKITSIIRNEIAASNNLILENDGSGNMLDKFDFHGKNIYFLNNENSRLANSSV